MTENEYAARIYCKVFQLESPDDDIYVRGTLDAISTLTEQEQRALRYYYRDGLTYKQTGAQLSLSESSANRVVRKALLKLRRPGSLDRIRVSRILNRCGRLWDLLGASEAETADE